MKNFRKKKEVIEHKMCVSIFSTNFFSEIFFILRRIERDVIKMYFGLHIKYPSYKVPFI